MYYTKFKIQQQCCIQEIDLGLIQSFVAQRDLALNSNTRVLSLVGYRRLFKSLVFDSKHAKLKHSKINNENSHAICASFLLFVFLTALKWQDLKNDDFIRNRQIFKVGGKRVYIQHRLGITERNTHLDDEWFENESDTIKLPIPPWLSHAVKISIPPTVEENSNLLSTPETYAEPTVSIHIKNRICTADHYFKIYPRWSCTYCKSTVSNASPKRSCHVLQQSQ